jgi:hypothetical protein
LPHSYLSEQTPQTHTTTVSSYTYSIIKSLGYIIYITIHNIYNNPIPSIR